VGPAARYLIVIEGAEGENFSAYAPDLPGCVATGATIEEVELGMHDAIEFHLEGLREAGEPIPGALRPHGHLRRGRRLRPSSRGAPGVPTTCPAAPDAPDSGTGP
jgi:predicted RNase H-like HicB family nuclease